MRRTDDEDAVVRRIVAWAEKQPIVDAVTTDRTSPLTHQRRLMYNGPMATTAPDSTDLDRAASLFRALSDPTRLRIVEMLRGGERCVCDMQEAMDAAQSRLSFHLRTLRDAGLVADRKVGRWNYYSIDPDALEAVAAWAEASRPDPGAHAGGCAGRCCCG